jgi:predicted O-linked N-acetylglucosamine transferase (SPINDLY family)
MIENHDRAAFDVVCYHNTFAADAVTARIKARASEWVECFNLTDQALAERIRDDRIDIVIDLSGHTHGHRLAALASQPAPLQMTYLGYPTTTGLAAIDYRITDAVIDPPALGNLNVETPLRLAASMFCYRPDTAPETGLPPFLQRGHMTFGSFNNGTKLSRRTLALWARVLNQVAGSTLFIKSQALAQESVRARLKKRMQDAGIDPQRVRFDPWRPDKASHLELYREVDIGLDTFPYNGATTTCEALWMGVPVITLSGTTHVSRMGASILAGAEHPEWVAADAEQFVAIATALAAQPDEIVRFRQQARTQLPRTPLMDGQRFTQDFERQLLRAWDARVEGATA